MKPRRRSEVRLARDRENWSDALPNPDTGDLETSYE